MTNVLVDMTSYPPEVLRCTDVEGFRWWLGKEEQVGRKPRQKEWNRARPGAEARVLSQFCSDAEKGWCAQQAAAGRCFRQERPRGKIASSA